MIHRTNKITGVNRSTLVNKATQNYVSWLARFIWGPISHSGDQLATQLATNYLAGVKDHLVRAKDFLAGVKDHLAGTKGASKCDDDHPG